MHAIEGCRSGFPGLPGFCICDCRLPPIAPTMGGLLRWPGRGYSSAQSLVAKRCDANPQRQRDRRVSSTLAHASGGHGLAAEASLGWNAEPKDRCRMELDFRKDPTILSTVVDAMAVAVFTVDVQGNFVAWSEGAERITGYAAGEVIGKPCHLLEGPNCKGFATLAELLQSSDAAPQGIFNQECKLLAKDGRELYIFGSVRLLRDERGQPQGAVGSFSDMTPFVQANEKIALLEEQTRSRTALGRLLGKSESMQEVFRRLRLAAQSDVTVLITGESGSGKELAAAAIHSLRRAAIVRSWASIARPYRRACWKANCSAMSAGAFTGAVRDKVGMFQAADGGTLFLDEIGDVSPLLQVKLLRVLQEREIRRVGDERAIKVDVRLLTATNRDLKSLIQSGQMREDFYYRIRVFEIVLPPLRERREDLPLLVTHFIEEFARIQSKQVSGIARDAMARMMHYRWPGNVRELKNAIEHAFVTVSGDRITLLDLPTEIRNEAEVDRQSARPPALSPRPPPSASGFSKPSSSAEAAAPKPPGGLASAASRSGNGCAESGWISSTPPSDPASASSGAGGASVTRVNLRINIQGLALPRNEHLLVDVAISIKYVTASS